MTKPVKVSFVANIQSKHAKEGRKVIEIPPKERKKFDVQAPVKVTLESI